MHFIGLSLLAALAILAFFGFGKRFFNRLGIKDWLIFLFILTLALGAIIAPIQLAETVYISIGGFVAPLIFSVILLYITDAKKQLFKVTIAVFLIASLTLGVRILLFGAINILAIAFIIGLINGICAYLITKNRASIIFSTILGTILGDTIYNLINRFTNDGRISFGGYATFDTFIMVCFIGMVAFEFIEFIKHKKRAKKVPITGFSFELAQDIKIKEKSDDELFKIFEQPKGNDKD